MSRADGSDFRWSSKSYGSGSDNIAQDTARYYDMVEYHFSGQAAFDREIAQYAQNATEPILFTGSSVGIGHTAQNSADAIPTDLEARVKAKANEYAPYLNSFLDALGKDVESHDFDVLYKRVKTIKVDNAPFIRAGEPGAAGLSEGDGSNRQIYIHHDYGAAGNNQEFRSNKIAAVVIFELLHHARRKGQYDDAALDKAALKLMNSDELKAARHMMKAPNYRDGTVAGRQFRDKVR